MKDNSICNYCAYSINGKCVFKDYMKYVNSFDAITYAIVDCENFKKKEK